jgi:hypothetical protein
MRTVSLTFPFAMIVCGCAVIVITDPHVDAVHLQPASKPTPRQTEASDADDLLPHRPVPLPARTALANVRWDVRAEGDCQHYRVRVFSVSSYCNCYECTNKHPGDPAYGITTSGTVAKRGTIAAPKGIPFGTRIYIPGVGVCVVEDRCLRDSS